MLNFFVLLWVKYWTIRKTPMITFLIDLIFLKFYLILFIFHIYGIRKQIQKSSYFFLYIFIFTFNIHRIIAEGVRPKTFCHYIFCIWQILFPPKQLPLHSSYIFYQHLHFLGTEPVTLALLALVSASRAAGTSLPARVCNPSSIIPYEISCCWLFCCCSLFVFAKLHPVLQHLLKK